MQMLLMQISKPMKGKRILLLEKQVVTGSGKADQYLDGNTFSNKLEQYKSRMIANGILEEDIDALMLNTQNTDTKKSFLTKYKRELSLIMINISGEVISLLQLLKG